MAPSPFIERGTHAGHTGWRMALPGGERVFIARQGGQLLSWLAAPGGAGGTGAQAQEQLYLSPLAAADGHTPIRGGVPVCFPQFNTRPLAAGGPLVAKHGFARNLPWALDGAVAEGRERIALLRLARPAPAHAAWPHGVELRLAVRLAPGRVAVGALVRNTGSAPMPFALALHTYLRLADATAAALDGLHGARHWDAVADLDRPAARRTQRGAVTLGAEVDRVFPTPAAGLVLRDGTRRLAIGHSASCSETVVWNPGPALCARLADMPPEGWRHMLCVEAARIDTPVLLAPGARWLGWQSLRLLAA